MSSGAAGGPRGLGGTEGAAGQGSSPHPSWGHQGSPSPGHWAGTSPGWDVASQQGGCVLWPTEPQPARGCTKSSSQEPVQCWLQPPSLIPPLQRLILQWSENPQKSFICNHAPSSQSSYCRKVYLRRTCVCLKFLQIHMGI